MAEKRVGVNSNSDRKKHNQQQRKIDRALAPVEVAQKLQIPVKELARAMRSAGITEPITPAQASLWSKNPAESPDWFLALLADRAAKKAHRDYRRQKQEEAEALRELVAEQSARQKILDGKRRFTTTEQMFVDDWVFRASKDLVRDGPDNQVTDEFERAVLAVFDIDPGDHSTWLIHMGRCDGGGPAHCSVRLDQIRQDQRDEAFLLSTEKEAALRRLSLAPGQYVMFSYDSKIGVVVKINKITVKVRFVSGGTNLPKTVITKNLDPRYIKPAPPGLPEAPDVGSTVTLRDRGRVREALVVAVDGPLFEATYSLKSGQWQSGWFDLLALGTARVDTGASR